MIRQEKLTRIQALQSELYDLCRDGSAAADPQAFSAGLLAWEATRLFWYAVRGDSVGASEKFGYVLEAVERIKRHQ